MIGIIIQARTGSKRFPRKIFADINGRYTLQRVLDGVKESKMAHKIILAMPEYDRKEIKERIEKGELNETLMHRGFSVYCGEPDDVLKRYYDAAGINGIDLIVRITADCPFIQGIIIDEMLTEYLSKGYTGYMCNRIKKPIYPSGYDVEIFPWWMLVYTHMNAATPEDREHVTTFMRKLGPDLIHPYTNHNKKTTLSNRFEDFSLDTMEDYELIKKIAVGYDKYGDLNKAIEMVDRKVEEECQEEKE
jgi:spore coat polysaccharide biosynthesis protein SpsF (cytidylyltransferase family)